MRNLVFFGHHKCASTWMGQIFYGIQAATGWTINYGLNPEFKLNVLGNSKVEYVSKYDSFLGVHLIRDPRDVIISGYHSHLKTHPTNKWPELIAFRNQLEAVDFNEGLFLEMDFVSSHLTDMMNWNYNDPRILELRFEEVTTNPNWNQFFEFLELSGSRKNCSSVEYYLKRTLNKLNNRGLYPSKFDDMCIPTEIAHAIPDQNSFKKLSGGRKKGETNENSHYRKGISGEWATKFTPEHKQYFKDKFPELLTNLGYEKDHDW